MPSPLVAIDRALSDDMRSLSFADPVTHVYNPLDYAREVHEAFLERFGKGKKDVLLIGMNPGPWGMAQTGVPFGDVSSVRDWMKLRGRIGKPAHEHPKRLVEGFDCPRSEVSWRAMVASWSRPSIMCLLVAPVATTPCLPISSPIIMWTGIDRLKLRTEARSAFASRATLAMMCCCSMLLRGILTSGCVRS